MRRSDRIRLFWSLAPLAAVTLIAAALAAVVFAGAFDVTASRPFSQPVSWLIHRAMINSVVARARAIPVPRSFGRLQVQAGFRQYEAHCAMCHGAPGIARQSWVSGMHPAPPFLIDAPRRWRPAELYFIVSNGVKMSAMPAWRRSLSSSEIWNLVAFLQALPNMSPADYVALRRAEAVASPGAGRPTPGAAERRRADGGRPRADRPLQPSPPILP